MVEFGRLHEDGSVTHRRSIPQEAIGACPHFILTPEHYREDDTCRCDDPDHTEMQGWGYAWDGDSLGVIKCPECGHYFEAVELDNVHAACRKLERQLGEINRERLDLLEERRQDDQALRIRRERPERELPTSDDPRGWPPRGSQRHRVLMALAERGAEGGSTEELMYDTDMAIRQVQACTEALRAGRWIAVREGIKHGTRMGGHANVLAPTRRGWRELHEREGVSVPGEMFYDPEPKTLFE